MMCITLAIPAAERGAAMLQPTTFSKFEDLSRISSQARSGRAFREARFWTRIEISSGWSEPMSPARAKPFPGDTIEDRLRDWGYPCLSGIPSASPGVYFCRCRG